MEYKIVENIEYLFVNLECLIVLNVDRWIIKIWILIFWIWRELSFFKIVFYIEGEMYVNICDKIFEVYLG